MLLIVLFATFAGYMWAQNPPLTAAQNQVGSPTTEEGPRPVYLLSAGDQIVIRAQNVEEISEKPFRIDNEGFLTLPIVGRIRAAGLTVEQLEAALTDRLKLFVRSPQVVVSLIETGRPQEIANPVYLVGAFKQPGVYPLGSRQETLSEVLMRTGGLLPTAMRRIRIVRRVEQGRLDLKNVTESTDGKTTYGEVALTLTGEVADPADNIFIKPQDVLIALKLEPVYVAGEVARSGAFPLEDRDYLSAAQILAMAGAGPAADLENVRVLRVVGDSSQRAEIIINIKNILRGKANDFPLMANDVLYVPRRSGATRVLAQIGLIAIPALITSLIWIWARR